MKYMILIHIAFAGSGGGGRQLSGFRSFDLSAGGLGAPGDRGQGSGAKPGAMAFLTASECTSGGCRRVSSTGIVLAARQVACRVGSRDGAAPPCWRRHPHRDLAVAGTGTRRRNDHVQHPCPYVNRLAGLVMYVLAW